MRKFVAVMDSGIGGITTLTEIIGAVKGYDFVYFADKKFAPYGDKSDREIQLRVKRLAGDFFEMGASALVIACNTATNVCIDCLRKEFSNKIIVGTEPAIKRCSLHRLPQDKKNSKALCKNTQKIAIYTQ